MLWYSCPCMVLSLEFGVFLCVLWGVYCIVLCMYMWFYLYGCEVLCMYIDRKVPPTFFLILADGENKYKN